MATAKSIISVAILGDAKNLTRALGQADKATGGLVKSAGKLLAGLAVVDTGFDFLKTSLSEADRLGDAMARLEAQVGPAFTARLADTADSFLDIGASSQDILELEAIFADFGTTAGITDTKIAGVAESVAALATALSLTDDQGRDASAMLDLITKAAGGSEKAARELGVTLLDNVDATTQLDNIMAQLNPKLVEATTGTGDLEQSQREMQARTEELSAKLGQKLAPALNLVLGFINDEIDAIPGAIEGWKMLGAQIEQFGRNVLGPLGNVRDVLASIVDLSGKAGSNLVGGGSGLPSPTNRRVERPRERDVVNNTRNFNDRHGRGTLIYDP